MKVSRLHSIRTRLMAGTALLIIGTVMVVVYVWASTTRDQLRKQTEIEARTFAVTLATAFMNELDDENWSQIRIGAEILVYQNDDFVYVIVMRQLWQHPTWKALNFSIALPHHYSYTYSADPTGTKFFTVRANGDLWSPC